MSILASRRIPPGALSTLYFPFEGGLNISTPAMSLEPGELVAANNFEIDIRGRYRRMDGYERFDGQTLPSKIEPYYRIPFNLGTIVYPTFTSSFSTAFHRNAPSSGDMVKGATTGATGTVLVASLEDITGDGSAGTFRTNDGEGYIYFVVTSGTLQDGEKLYFLNKDSAFGGEFSVEYK